MKDKEILELARFIFTNGRIIRDHFFRVHQRAFAESCEENLQQELSVAQMHTIMAVKERGKVTIKELAEHLLVSPPSASVMVDRLVEKGILLRQQSEADRRKVVVSLSPEAIIRSNASEEVMFRHFVELVEQIGVETARKWVEVVGKIREVLKEGQDHGK